MSEVWEKTRIADVVDIQIGGTPSRICPSFWAEKPAGHPWIAISDLKSKFIFDTQEYITDLGARCSNVKLIPSASTVMSFKLSVGRTGITVRPMYCNEAIAIFLPRSEQVNSRWLFHALPMATSTVVTDTAVKGVTLNKAKMSEMVLNLPSPIEQLKIAEILDTLDIAIHKTDAIIEKLKQVKQGLLHDLLTRGVDANGELRPSYEQAPDRYQNSPLGWIPNEWQVLPIEECGEIVTGSTPPSYDPRAWGDKTPFITPADVVENGEIQTAERYVSERGYRYVRLLPPQTILVVCIGSTIGKVGITGTLSCTNQQINAVIPNPGFESSFLFHTIRKNVNQLRAMAGLQAVPIVKKLWGRRGEQCNQE